MGLNFHVCLNFIMIIPLGASSFFEYYYITYIYIAMIDLLISTFAMMGLTFLIGFFVAAVIKLPMRQILLIFIVLIVWNC